MSIGERMLKFRAMRRITQKQLSEMLGVPIYTVFSCENNKHKPTKANEIYLSSKLKELEESENDNVQMQ